MASSHEDDADRRTVGPANVTGSLPGSIQAAERRLADLAAEMGRVVETAPNAEREALREYAVSLVRDNVPIADSSFTDVDVAGDVEDDRVPASRSSSAASLVGYGILLLPVGFLLSIVFPFGLFLVVDGLLMIGLGVLTSLVTRFVPKRTGAGDS